MILCWLGLHAWYYGMFSWPRSERLERICTSCGRWAWLDVSGPVNNTGRWRKGMERK